MPSTQKKIRDIERALRRKDADDPSVPILNEKLVALKAERAQHAMSEKEKKFSQKYHMVKFFERKKLTRCIRKLEKKISNQESGSEEADILRGKITKLEEDLAYVLYYPKTMKYVSLFSKAEEKGAHPPAAAAVPRQSKARSAALKAWRDSVEAGEDDKVAHAMEVEREGASRKSAVKPIAIPHSATIKPQTSTMSSDKATSKAAGNRRRASRGGSSSSEGSGSEASGDSHSESNASGDEMQVGNKGQSSEDDSSSSEDNRPVSTTRGKPSNDTSSSDSESSGSSGEMNQSSSSKDSDASDDSDSSTDKQAAPTTKYVSKPSGKGGADNTATDAAKDYEPDAFFLEEAADGVENVDLSSSAAPPRRGGGFRGGRGGGRSNGGRYGAMDSSKPLHKQQARLLKWQSGHRGGGGAGRGGRGGATGGGDTEHDEGRGNKKRKDSDSRHASFDRDSGLGSKRGRGSARGVSDGRGGRGRGREGGFSRRQPTDDGGTKAAWEEGGGVSALHVTAAVKQKQAGTIVLGASSSKKITFDD